MKKFILLASALAFSGSMAFSMEEGEAMDEEMMMEAPAPSVSLGGSAKIGVKNVDDSAMPDADSVTLVRAYKVTFASSSTTDGGLVFGAGMSIRDDTGETDGPGDTQAPAVKGSHVYVGGADGSWKIQFGGNDPGALLAGGIGFADDRIDRGDASVSLSGNMQGVDYRLTVADPQKDSNDWSVGAKFSAGQIGVGVGMDSEDGLAVGVSTDVSGLSTTVYYAQSEGDDMISGMTAAVAAVPDRTISATYGSSVVATDAVDGDGAAQASTITYTYQATPMQGDADYKNSGKVDRTVVVSYDAGTAPDRGDISAITGIATVANHVPTLGNGILTITNNGGTADDATDDVVVARYELKPDAGTGITVPGTDAVPAKAITEPVAGKWTGIGAKVAIPAGEGASISVGYSRMKKDVSSDMGSASAKSSRIELDFSYDLGGGATFTAGIDKDDKEELMTDGESFMTTSSDKTTLEAAISMSF